MNRELVEKMLEVLRAMPDASPEGTDGLTFDMSLIAGYKPECGTACCMAGLAMGCGLGWDVVREFVEMDFDQSEFTLRMAQRKLGLSDPEARALFYPNDYTNSKELYTREAGISVLGRMLETGEVNWPRAIAEVAQ